MKLSNDNTTAYKEGPILFFSHEAALYGAPRSLFILIKHLVDCGYSVHVACFGGGPFTELLQQNGIPYTIIKTQSQTVPKKIPFSRNVYLLYSIVKCYSLISKLAPKLVYINTIVRPEPAIAAKLCTKPCIYHVRESNKYLSNNGFFNKLRLWTLRNVPSAYICVSNATKAMICEAGINPDMVKTIYNGVDIRKFTRDPETRERMRKTLGVKEDTVVFGFVGNIIERKGVDFILKAAKTLISEERDIHFLFVGGDPSTHYFINTIVPLIEELPIPGKVTFIPAVSDTKPYYDSMDIYLMTSKQEPFGRVNIEAMAMELPVIATAIDGNLEVIVPDETGFLFELGDISAFCQILDYCVNNRNRLISMGKAGRKRVTEHFTQDICSQKCESVILANLNIDTSSA